MGLRWIGAALVFAGCGCFGFSLAARYRDQIAVLTQLKKSLQLMHSELSCRMTPLPELFYKLSQMSEGRISALFSDISELLRLQVSADASQCMESVLSVHAQLPRTAVQILKDLGQGLGAYDLDGQLKQLSAVTDDCGRMLETLNQQKEDRIRQYQTLGLCAGAGLAILLI